MDRLFTPLLRRVYGAFIAFAMIYVVVLQTQKSSWYKERLYRRLLSGATEEQAAAAFDLAYLQGEEQLLRALKSRSADVRHFAVQSIENLWVHEQGSQAFQLLQKADQASGEKAYPEALKILNEATIKYPEFAEAWNRRATLFWRMGRLDEAVADSQKAVLLNPNHFGAWQGMGLCAMHLGRLDQACHCIRAALRILPFDPNLKQFLGHCERLLQMMSPADRVFYDTV